MWPLLWRQRGLQVWQDKKQKILFFFDKKQKIPFFFDFLR